GETRGSVLFLVFYLRQGLTWKPWFSKTPYADQAGLELKIHLPVSQALGSKCVTPHPVKFTF
ncbi:hypothetical protein ACQP3D_29260, partial [Escherichia coli]